MRIIVDMDEVIVDMMTKLLSMYNLYYKSDITVDDITQWQLPDDMLKVFHHRGFFRYIPAIPGAIDGVRQLRSMGHDIIIASNHSDRGYIADDKIMWVQEHLPELAGNMMIGARKDILQGDAIIDDNPDYLINSPCRVKICMDRPWNRRSNYTRYQHDCFYKYFYRVYNWQQIRGLFEVCKGW
jgi:5'(3')-deoxyribonucleotidase